MTRVCLVCMPFAAVQRPALALGLLQALLEEDGIPCRSLYPNLEWARRLGPDRYGFWEDTLGDMVFARAARREPVADLDHYLARRLRTRGPRALRLDLPGDLEGLVREARAVIDQAEGFVADMARAAVDTGAEIFGCTSMYWQQTASLAFLREVRRLCPGAITMLGGANCEGAMGRALHRHFPWVDFVVSGEADDFFAPWCRALLEGGRGAEELPEGVLGPSHRLRGYPDEVPRALCRDLGCLPTPQYRDYFASLQACGLEGAIRPGLPLETARGCWWGQKHPCTFCGISPAGLRYHSKPAGRVLQELRDLEERHGLNDFEVTDNILDMAYFRTLLPALAAEGRPRRIFWEVKANLKREQVALLARAGVSWVQPGIEALDSRLLRLLGKGVEAVQNVRFLKWCREQGLAVSWNMLWGFPGEEDEWYADTARRLPDLVHLQPPRGLLRLRIDRFSTYQSRPRDFGIRIRPARFQSWIYGLPEADLEDLGYYFELENPAAWPVGPGLRSLVGACRSWQERFWSPVPPVLSLEDDGRVLRLLDGRDPGAARTVDLQGELRATYLRAEEGLPRTAAGPEEAIRELLERRLVMELDGRLLGLAVRGCLPRTPTPDEFPGGHVDFREVRRRRVPRDSLPLPRLNLLGPG